MRSNTTIVSWTEKPMTVSIAVTNRASISTWKNVPRIAKAPTTTTTSCSSETSAVTPNFTSRKRYVIQPTMASEPTTMRIRAWRSRSELTTAPMVVRLACDSIGPSCAWSAVTISPSFPSVGSRVLPTGAAEGDADGEADAPAEADGAGVGDGAGDPDAPAGARADADGPGDPHGEAEAATDGDGAGDPLGPAEPDGDADGETEAAGCSCSPIGSVLISMNPVPVRIATASRSFWANTSSTCSGVTAGSANLISHRVPPVKSMVSCSP